MGRITKMSFFIILLCFHLRSAGASSDFQIWSEVGLKYRITKRFLLEFDQLLRFDDNSSRVESIMPELSLEYKAAKFIGFSAGYRFIIKPKYLIQVTYYDKYHRFFADIVLRHTFRPIAFRYRFRYQEEFGWPYEDFGHPKYEHTIRNKGIIELDIGKGFRPFTSGELFLRLGDKDGLLHKWRAALGTEYNLKPHQFSIYYQMERMLDNPDKPTVHILGLSYHYTF